MEFIAVFLPLLGALIAGLFGKVIGDKGSQFITCFLMVCAAAASLFLFKDVAMASNPRVLEIFTWISSGDLNVSWALRFDQIAVVMVFVVNIVSAVVHIYSVGYMSHDPAKAKFMAYLSLFTFAMLMLVTADNLVQLFFGWEGVGVASYLLIGFWNHKESANSAAIKAFVMNRIGDFGLALGIMVIFFAFGTLNFDEIFIRVEELKDLHLEFLGFDVHMITLACALLFVGAMGKSAQLGLHTWLPDAMEGPTPVSALIHAATMVTAGVFLVVRMSPLFEYAPSVLMFICILGALTALIAATIAVTQNDIKRVIAYSTMSQLGYMFFALGVSAYSAAMFHLFTHAFFKALLFLGAGSVIHAMSDEQDMRKMGGIYKLIPATYIMMWIGSLALAGVPFFAGYFSKDMVLEVAYADHTWFGMFAYWVGIFVAFLTAFYSFRLIFMAFHGKPRCDEKVMDHVHESPKIMLRPLYVLVIGAVTAGYSFKELFVGSDRGDFFGKSIFVLAENDTVAAAHHVPTWVAVLPAAVGIVGIILAWVFYIKCPKLPEKIANAFKWIYKFFLNKWYFDELYNRLVVKPLFCFGSLFWKIGDVKIIDGLGPNGVAKLSKKTADLTSKLQSGYVYHYAFVMLIGIVCFVSFYLFKFNG